MTLLAAHVQAVGTLGDEGWLFTCSGSVFNRNSAGNQWRRLRAKVGMDAGLMTAARADSLRTVAVD